MDRGAWRATVHRVAKSRTLQSNFTELTSLLLITIYPSGFVKEIFIGLDLIFYCVFT